MVDRAPAGLEGDAPLLLVEDTMAALTALGHAGRRRSRARIAAITGSVGKTGSKEALRLALGEQAPTHASAASHNNHWGVPLSLARAPQGASFARLRARHERARRDRARWRGWSGRTSR